MSEFFLAITPESYLRLSLNSLSSPAPWAPLAATFTLMNVLCPVWPSLQEEVLEEAHLLAFLLATLFPWRLTSISRTGCSGAWRGPGLDKMVIIVIADHGKL